MAVSNSLASSIVQFKTGIVSRQPQALKQATMDFYRFASESGVTPVRSGDLRRSAMISSSFSEGIVRWSTPYARRRNIEGSITGIANWDMVTWEKHKETIIGNYMRFIAQN